MTIVKTYKGHDVPEGATHYAPKQTGYMEGFYKIIEGNVSFCAVGKSGSSFRSASDFILGRESCLIKLPQEPEQYMPKVGDECEYVINDSDSWYKCQIFDIGQVGIYMYCHHFDTSDYMYQWVRKATVAFRPIKTEREKVIEWAMDKVCEPLNILDDSKAMGHLYDLGALKIPDSEK